jgi:ATP-binding cassette, subfamily B, multidrug efflux pump
MSLRRILPYYRPYRRTLWLGLFWVAVAQGFSLLAPYLIMLAIDALGRPDVTAEEVTRYAVLIVATAVLGGVGRYGMRDLLNGISRRMEVDIRKDLFRHLMTLDASFYSRWRTGDLMSRATNDTLAVRQAAGPAVMYAMNTVLGFAIALGFMLHLSPRLTLYAMLPMLALPPLVLGFGRSIHRRFEKIQEHYSTLSNMVQENLAGVRIVRAYVQEDAQALEFDALNDEYRRRNMHLVRSSGLLYPLLGFLTGVALVTVLWMGGREVIAGRITIGAYVAFFFYLSFLSWPMIALGWVLNFFQRGSASMGRLDEIFAERSSLVRAEPHASAADVKGRIELRNVSFRYPGTERWVLRDVSFVAEPGQTVAIVGPTGSGKTTMISLIPRLYDPTDGEVLLDGVPLPHYDVGEARDRMGIVPQDPFLFSASVRENIALGSASSDRASRDLVIVDDTSSEIDGVVEAASIAQLHDSIEGFPSGYDTMLGERGINLSGGQKQRATLARALARDPRVLVLDDALSAVDTQTEAKILADLRGVMSERTSFVISHRVSAVMHADQILVLEDGRIVERGTHGQLAQSGGTYARLLRRQMLEQDLADRSPLRAAGD